MRNVVLSLLIWSPIFHLKSFVSAVIWCIVKHLIMTMQQQTWMCMNCGKCYWTPLSLCIEDELYLIYFSVCCYHLFLCFIIRYCWAASGWYKCIVLIIHPAASISAFSISEYKSGWSHLILWPEFVCTPPLRTSLNVCNTKRVLVCVCAWKRTQEAVNTHTQWYAFVVD